MVWHITLCAFAMVGFIVTCAMVLVTLYQLYIRYHEDNEASYLLMRFYEREHK